MIVAGVDCGTVGLETNDRMRMTLSTKRGWRVLGNSLSGGHFDLLSHGVFLNNGYGHGLLNHFRDYLWHLLYHLLIRLQK
jgi:hypothetical protein